MKKKHSLFYGLIFLFILFILFRSCNSCSSNSRNGKKNDITIKTPSDTTITNYSRISHVTFYIENSGSMFGYVSGATEFVNAVNDLAQFPNLVLTNTHFSYNLISGKSNYERVRDKLTSYPIGSDAEILRSQLTVTGFDKPSSGNSDLKRMFEIALSKAQKDSISILISDCIYDVGGTENPLGSLKNEVASTRTNFIQRLQKDDIETLLIKLESNFNGSYHPANVTESRGTSRKINQKRPYYIWIFGNSELLKQYFPEDEAKKLMGYIDLTRFRKLSNHEFPYTAIGYKNVGFRLKNGTQNTFKLYHNVTDSSSFNIAVDFSDLNLSDTYLTSSNNYFCSGNYVVKKISAIEKSPNSILKTTLDMLIPLKPTHIITIASTTTTQPELGEMSITLNSVLPTWIKESNTDNDYPFDGDTTKTFGFSTLIKGIDEAYKRVSRKEHIAKFNITIKN